MSDKEIENLFFKKIKDSEPYKKESLYSIKKKSSCDVVKMERGSCKVTSEDDLSNQARIIYEKMKGSTISRGNRNRKQSEVIDFDIEINKKLKFKYVIDNDCNIIGKWFFDLSKFIPYNFNDFSLEDKSHSSNYSEDSCIPIGTKTRDLITQSEFDFIFNYIREDSDSNDARPGVVRCVMESSEGTSWVDGMPSFTISTNVYKSDNDGSNEITIYSNRSKFTMPGLKKTISTPLPENIPESVYPLQIIKEHRENEDGIKEEVVWQAFNLRSPYNKPLPSPISDKQMYWKRIHSDKDLYPYEKYSGELRVFDIIPEEDGQIIYPEKQIDRFIMKQYAKLHAFMDTYLEDLIGFNLNLEVNDDIKFIIDFYKIERHLVWDKNPKGKSYNLQSEDKLFDIHRNRFKLHNLIYNYGFKKIKIRGVN